MAGKIKSTNAKLYSVGGVVDHVPLGHTHTGDLIPLGVLEAMRNDFFEGVQNLGTQWSLKPAAPPNIRLSRRLSVANKINPNF
jgi:hypothetical protein